MMRRPWTTLAAALLVASMGGAPAQAQDEPGPVGVLFVGNSLTYWNGGVETHVAALAASEDPPLMIEAERATAPAYTLEELYRLSMPGGGPTALEAIRAGGHDVVVLQDDIPDIYSKDIATFLEYARLFDQEVTDAGARSVFYMTWPIEAVDWVTLEDIVDAHRTVESELGAVVAPVGTAMAKATAERPDLSMLDTDDLMHPSLAGTYLAANVLYAAMFDEDPRGLAYRPDDITEDEAAFLQRVAQESVEEWNARASAE
jgi:hypothetical protein